MLYVQYTDVLPNFTKSPETTLAVESCGFLIAGLWAFVPGLIYLPKT